MHFGSCMVHIILSPAVVLVVLETMIAGLALRCQVPPSSCAVRKLVARLGMQLAHVSTVGEQDERCKVHSSSCAVHNVCQTGPAPVSNQVCTAQLRPG